MPNILHQRPPHPPLLIGSSRYHHTVMLQHQPFRCLPLRVTNSQPDTKPQRLGKSAILPQIAKDIDTCSSPPENMIRAWVFSLVLILFLNHFVSIIGCHIVLLGINTISAHLVANYMTELQTHRRDPILASLNTPSWNTLALMLPLAKRWLSDDTLGKGHCMYNPVHILRKCMIANTSIPFQQIVDIFSNTDMPFLFIQKQLLHWHHYIVFLPLL